jgi:hypothetical protein
MNVGGVSSSAAQVAAAVSRESENSPAQVMLLKRLLESQRREADQMLRLLEGKGQNLDIRV